MLNASKLIVEAVPAIVVFFTARTVLTRAITATGAEVTTLATATAIATTTAEAAATAAVATAVAAATATAVAATIAAATAVAATAAKAATAASATRAELALGTILSFLHYDGSTIEIRTIQSFYGIATGIVISHFYKTITLGATRFTVHNYLGRGYLAKLFKSCLQILTGGSEIELGYKNVHTKKNSE